MIILDKDALSLLDRERIVESSALRRNLEKYPLDEIFTTIITFEEHMRGWLAFISKCKNIEEQLFAYERLNGFLDNFRKISVLDFDEKAAAEIKKTQITKNPRRHEGFENRRDCNCQ